jgi:hypothetical protein
LHITTREAKRPRPSSTTGLRAFEDLKRVSGHLVSSLLKERMPNCIPVHHIGPTIAEKFRAAHLPPVEKQSAIAGAAFTAITPSIFSMHSFHNGSSLA